MNLDAIKVIQLLDWTTSNSLSSIKRRAIKSGKGTAAWNTAIEEIRARRSARQVNTLEPGRVRVIRVQMLSEEVTSLSDVGIVVYQKGYKVLSVYQLMAICLPFDRALRVAVHTETDLLVDSHLIIS